MMGRHALVTQIIDAKGVVKFGTLVSSGVDLSNGAYPSRPINLIDTPTSQTGPLASSLIAFLESHTTIPRS